MSQPPALPTHARIAIDQFLAYSGWDVPSPAYRDSMRVALDFFQDKIPAETLRQRIANPSPWALPRGGAIKLCELMQAIDFNRPVVRAVLPMNTRLLAFLHQDVGKHDIEAKVAGNSLCRPGIVAGEHRDLDAALA